MLTTIKWREVMVVMEAQRPKAVLSWVVALEHTTVALMHGATVGDTGTRGPRVPRPEQQSATWHPPAGVISLRYEKTKSRERVLGVMNSGPRVPEFSMTREDQVPRRECSGLRTVAPEHSSPPTT